MTSELRTTLSQLYVVNGQRQSHAPGVLAVEKTPRSAARGRGQDRLYILAELHGETYDKDDLLRQMVEITAQAYYDTPGSVTGGLREGLNAASSILFHRNADTPYEGHLLGGIVCAVLRGNECLVGQIGPAVAHVAHGGKMERYPASSPWLDKVAGGEEASASALGLSRFVEGNFFRCEVEAGDVVILTGVELARRASVAAVGAAVIQQPVDVALGGLAKLGGEARFSALLIGIDAVAVAPQPAKAKGPEVKPPARDVDWADEPEYEEPEVISRPQRKAAAERGPSPKSESPLAKFWRSIDLPRLLGSLGKALAALLALLWSSLSTLWWNILPGDRGKQPPSRRPAKAEGKGEAAPGSNRRKILLGVAITIPLLILLVVGVTYLQKGQAREQQFNDLVQKARTNYQQATSSGDESAAISLLKEALELLDKAEEIKPGESETALLRREIEDRSDKVNKVHRLVWFAELHTYGDEGTALGRVLLSGVDVYVLDRGLGRIYHHQLNEAGDGLRPDEGNPAVVTQGQEIEGKAISRLIDMTWVQAGGGRQTSDLLALAEGPALLEYNPTWGITPLPIGGTESWKTPLRTGSYFGNFYVLDPGAGQIFRYLPTSTGYGDSPQGYLPEPNPLPPDAVVDMAIDGHIYLLFADGTIRKFLGGEPVSFEIGGLSEPLKKPVAIYTAPDEQGRYIYIADAGAERIVQIDKDGQLVQQFKSSNGKQFADLRGLYVDEIGGKLYFTGGNRLYLTSLPTN